MKIKEKLKLIKIYLCSKIVGHRIHCIVNQTYTDHGYDYEYECWCDHCDLDSESAYEIFIKKL